MFCHVFGFEYACCAHASLGKLLMASRTGSRSQVLTFLSGLFVESSLRRVSSAGLHERVFSLCTCYAFAGIIVLVFTFHGSRFFFLGKWHCVELRL